MKKNNLFEKIFKGMVVVLDIFIVLLIVATVMKINVIYEYCGMTPRIFIYAAFIPLFIYGIYFTFKEMVIDNR